MYISQSSIDYILDAMKSNDFSVNSNNTRYYALKKYLERLYNSKPIFNREKN